MMNVFNCSVALVAAGLLAVTAHAGRVQVIDDRSFFDNVPHTLVDFSTRGNEAAWPPLAPGQTLSFPPNEYSSLGVSISSSSGFPFTPRVALSDNTGIIPAALDAAGSSPYYVADFALNGFLRFDFDAPVLSFGIAVMQTTVNGLGPVSLEAFDSNGQLLETVNFEGSLVDGVIVGAPLGNSNDIAYGFMGVEALQSPFSTIIIHEGVARFDDLFFSVVPEPATWLGFSLIAVYCARRRRRVAAALASLVLTSVTVTAQAGPVQVIDDRSFFDNIPHTLIDFSTRGNGTAWPPLTPGQTFGFSEAEYTSSGVRISTAGNFPFFPRVVRNPDSGAIPVALEQVGSAPFFISEFAEDGFLRFDFEEPTQAFGIAVLRTIEDGRGPVRLEAMDVNGVLLGMIPLEGDLVDGIVDGAPLGNTADIEYGFLGIQSNGVPIGTVLLHDDFAYYDDLYFSVVPEPATWLGFGLIAAFCICRRRRGTAVLASLALTGITMTAQAGPVQVIDDRSFFDNIPHTLIDFNSRRDGMPWSAINPGQSVFFPPNEYSSQGVQISSPVLLGAVRSHETGAVRASLNAAGSAPFYITSPSSNGFVRFDFDLPVRAFGIAAMRLAGDDFGPVSIEAIESTGGPLHTIVFSGQLIDGLILGEHFDSPYDIEYGFLGIQSQTPFTTVMVHEDAAWFDDLYFSVVPEPATWLGVSLIAVFCARRRVS